MRKYLGIIILLFLLVGCSSVPEWTTKKTYSTLQEAYNDYQEARVTNDTLYGNDNLQEVVDIEPENEQEEIIRGTIIALFVAHENSINDIDNSTWNDVVTSAPNKLAIEVFGPELEEIKGLEESLRTHLDIDPLPINENIEEKNKAAHEKATTFIPRLLGMGDLMTHTDYEDSYVTYREETDDYYVASAFTITADVGPKSVYHKYDMILDNELNLIDVYIAGIEPGAFYSKPMNKDQRPTNMDTFNDRLTGNVTESEEKESIMDSIYGTEDDEYDDDLQEDIPSETAELEWNKEEYLYPILQNTSELLTELRHINTDALSLNLDEDYANKTLQALEMEKSNLDYIRMDPDTNHYLDDSELHNINQAISEIDEAIQAEQTMLSDPSTQNIRIADSSVENAQSIVEAFLAK